MQKNHKLGYRPDIEGLRALAILLVVAAHMNLPGFQGGFIGVDMFFVLSGYLITALLVLEMQATGRVDMWGFYARRLRRLAPGLFLVVLASCLLAWALLRPAHQATQVNAAASALVWLSNFFYAFSEIGYFEPGAENSLFLHTWSLGVEEQFYLVWPWLLLLAFWWAQKRQAAKATPDDGAQDRARYWKRMMWLVFALSLALCLILMRLHPASAFYMMPARAWQFALGALTWLYFRDRSAGGVLSPPAAPKGRMLTELCGWLGLAAIALALLWCSPDAPYPGYRALLPSLGAALLLAAGSRAKHGGGGTILFLLCLRPMQALGHVSYSWYLWHWPILVLGTVVYTNASLAVRTALALFALLLACISFYCVERPIRRQEALLRRPAPMVAGVMTTLVSGSLLCLLWFSVIEAEMFAPENQKIMDASWDTPHILDCDDWYKSADVNECTFGDQNAPRSAVLLGDSIGTQWFPALEKRFTQPGWRLSVLTKSACPMVDKPAFFYARIGRDYTECVLWRENVIKLLQARHTDTIILGSSLEYPFTPEEWTEGTQKILKALSPHAKNIVLIRSTPVLPFNGLYCLTGNKPLVRLLAGDDRCRAPSADARNDAVYAALQAAVAPFGNARTLDMNDAICPGGMCHAQQDGYVTFRDRNHLTASFVKHLGEQFGQRLQAGGQ